MATHDLLLFVISFFWGYVVVFCLVKYRKKQKRKTHYEHSSTYNEHGSVVIPRDAFMCEIPSYISGDQKYLYVLQQNGVPISGIFYLQLDRRFVYTVQKEPDDLSVRVEWRMK